jgi:hypothetical protein
MKLATRNEQLEISKSAAKLFPISYLLVIEPGDSL